LGLITLTDGEVIEFEVIKDDLREFNGRFDVQQVALTLGRRHSWRRRCRPRAC